MTGHDAEERQFIDNMAVVEEMQKEWRNPIPQVALRAGFYICREIMARFIEQGGDEVTAASVRANWLPALGDDHGAPRQFAWDELMGEDLNGQFFSKEVSASLEGCCYAWVAMHQFGILPASAIEARSDETAQQAQPEGQERDPQGDAQTPPLPPSQG